MNSAFRMLLAAMMRARWVGWLRIWIRRVHGHAATEPGDRPAAPGRPAITPVVGAAQEGGAAIISAPGGPRQNRSNGNTLMPRAPSGTRPISTWRRDGTSHSSEPMPMPTENTTSSSEATCSLPCSTSLGAGKLRQEHRPEEPHPADAQQRAEHHHVAVRQRGCARFR